MTRLAMWWCLAVGLWFGAVLPRCAVAAWPTREYAPYAAHSYSKAIPTHYLAGQARLEGVQNHVDVADNYDLRRETHAPQMLSAVLPFVSHALADLEAEGWNAPMIDPLVHTPDGAVRWGLVWLQGRAASGTFMYRSPWGQGPDDWTYVVGNANNEAKFDASYARNPKRIRGHFAYQLIHETVHAIQAVSNQGENEAGARFLVEGLAEAVAVRLAVDHDPDLPDLYRMVWMLRSFESSLDARGQTHDDSLAYGAGAFYRYLVEASRAPGAAGTSGSTGWATVRPLVEAGPSQVDSRAGAYRAIEGAIKKQLGDAAQPALTFAEFLTEYASYGGTRYTTTQDKNGKTSEMTHDEWFEWVFPKRKTLVLSSEQASQAREVTVQPVAGQGLRVHYNGVADDVTLQITVRVASKELADQLHLGEVRRSDPAGTHHCWDTTKLIRRRLHQAAADKCIVRRALVEVGAVTYVHFALDKVAKGHGMVDLVLVNAGPSLNETKEVAAHVEVGVIQVQNGEAQVTPRITPQPRIQGADIEQGMARLESRVDVHSFSKEHLLFEGMPIGILGEGEHFFGGAGAPSMAMAAGEPAAEGVLIRSKEYLVVVARGPDGTELSGRHSAIIKDPENMGNPLTMVMTVGSEAYPGTEDCGYLTEVQLEELERGPGHAAYRLQADLFQPMKMAMGGEGCAALEAGWVERVDLRVSVPRPHLMEGEPVSRVRTELQGVYDGDGFPDGPTLGGIATAESRRVDGTPDIDELQRRERARNRDGDGDDPWSRGPDGGANGPPAPAFDPERARQLACLLPVREGGYTDMPEAGEDALLLGLRTSGCLCMVAAATHDPAWSDRFDEGIAERVQEEAADCPEATVPSPDELAELEQSTLDAFDALEGLSEGNGSLDDLRTAGEFFGVDVSAVPGFDWVASWFGDGAHDASEAASGEALPAEPEGAGCAWLKAGLAQEGMWLSATLAAAAAADCTCALAAAVDEGASASAAAQAALAAEDCPDE